MFVGDIQVDTRQRSKPENIPSPTGGLNVRDSLAAMPPTDAYIMENILPGTTSCKLRKGCDKQQDSLGPPVTSMTTYISGEDQFMYALSGDILYDVSVYEEPEIVRTGILGDDIVSTMFSNAADNAQWLICVTGQDVPFAFNGSAWSTLVITDAGGASGSPALLTYVCPYKGRLFWAYRGMCGFYYLPPGAIQGAAEYFDLGQIAHKGGAVVAIATCSDADAGDGPHQYIVFITNQGEYIMYAGDDPGDLTAWQLVGRYTSGRPIGRHAVCDYAGDLLILTQEGVLQFSSIRKTADTRTELIALSSKLGDGIKAKLPFEDMPGWSIFLYPKDGIVQVNSPNGYTPSAGVNHNVMNTTTQAWAKVVSSQWDGISWTIFHDQLYFGRYDGTVRKAYVGETDFGHGIHIRVCQAYNYFGNSQNKQFKWVECLISCETYPPLAGLINTNFFNNPLPPFGQQLPTDLGGVWDISYWDQDFWAVAPEPLTFIIDYQNWGFVASMCLHGEFKGMTFEWWSSKWVYEVAEGLL